ncbi:unnamed protein product [Peronospora belbahrii]|uniref:HNH nuclease domain-containing protein n=1 Tax=Peronospora belbahrii TaxID=622444 RepID=A0AAU9L5S9_9STRA|nr:unnamed protein product [Peronospora belbahrii]
MHIIPLSCRNTAHSGIVSPLDSRASLSVDDDDDAMTYRYKSEFRWMRHVIRAQDHEMRLDVGYIMSLPSLAQSFLQKQLRKRKIQVQCCPSFNVSSDQTSRANSLVSS